MVSIYELKSSFQNLLRPLTNALANLGVTANQVTIAAAVFSFFLGLAIYFYPTQDWPFLLVPIILFVRMVLNAIDGMLAREHNMQSSLGAFLNELGDVFSDTFIYLPFIFVPVVSPTLIMGIVILGIISEMTGVIAIQVGADRRYDGPMGKSDRAFIFSLVSILLVAQVNQPFVINGIFLIVNILLLATIANRLNNALNYKNN